MQAMATGNPGNVSIIAKSSTSPPPGAQAAAAAALNSMSNSSSRPPSEAGNGSMNGMNNTSPLSMTPPGLAGGIFPAIPTRDELINRIRERAIFGGIGAPGLPSPTSAPTSSNGGGFDLASFFPNIAAAAKLTGVNPAALAGLLPPGLFPNGSPGSGVNMGTSKNESSGSRKRSDAMKSQPRTSSGDEDMGMNDDSDYPGAMMIDEDEGEEINCEGAEDDEEMEASAGNGAMNGNGDEYGVADELIGNSTGEDGHHDDEDGNEPFLSLTANRDMDSPAISANGSRRSSVNNARKLSTETGSVTLNINHMESPLASLQHQFQNAPQSQQQPDLPILRSAISASPLNSLLYQKKLNNALRNKNTDQSLMANFFYPNPLQQLQQVQMQLAAAAQQQQNQQRRDQYNHQQRRKSSSAVSTSSIASGLNSSAPAANGFSKHSVDLSVKREHLTPSPLIATGGEHSQTTSTSGANGSRLLTTNPASDSGVSGAGSHISPTESSVGSSSASTASSAGQTSPTSILDTLASVAAVSGSPLAGTSGAGRGGNGDPCAQCTVLKGRLALTENRCRFLESKTTSQESKISRLESRIGTLESNGRRYENEAHMLRDHCEQLERKVLDCQERVLRYLQGQQYDQDTTKQMLYDILETCRVYKPA